MDAVQIVAEKAGIALQYQARPPNQRVTGQSKPRTL